MSVLNCVGEPEECPLCMEPFEIDDLNFFPCTCGYQICRFCWHRIRTDENGLCPACRKAYPENPANFKPLTQEELQHIKQEKRQKDLQRKQKVTENRKHLANVRVVQKNLVFVVGLSSRLADPETLKKSEYFGKFGKILKVVINHSTTYAGSQGPSASAYVTYQRAEDALRAIQAVNNIHVDGRILKASLGTTKYCSHFMKNQQCPKADCMYLHEMGDESASFTKEEMQQGKHQEFEKKLQEHYLGTNSCNSEKTNGISPSCSSANITATDTTTTTSTTPSGPLINTSGSSGHATNKKGENSNSNSTKEMNGTNSSNRGGSLDHLVSDTKDSWPALHVNSNKEHSSKRTRSKSERTSSARHTPTEENNKRNNREREKRHGNQKENSINHKDINIEDDSGNSSTTTTTQSQSLSTTPCSTQESCTSSASTTPPPQNLESLSVPPTPPHSASSPMPMVDASRHRTEREQTNSPIGTTPSSLSSCSELSSSLPPSQHISLASSVSNSVPRTSLFSDNSNSFFSQQTLSLHEGLQVYEPTLEEPNQNGVEDMKNDLQTDTNQSFSNLTNGEQNSLPLEWRIPSVPEHVFLSEADHPSSSNGWNAIFELDSCTSDIKNSPVIEHRVDDELGFDPFEETNKALAEDILLERKQQQMQQHLELRQQQLFQQKLQQHQHQQHQLQLQQSGIKNYFEGFPSGVAKDLSQTRLPPPGFNGMSMAGFSSVAQQSQSHINKVIPPFIGNTMGASHISTMGSANSTPTQINGIIGSNRIGVPPGLAGNLGGGNLLNGVHSGLVGNINNTLSTHHLTSASLMSLESNIGVSQAPPGLGMTKPADPFVLKDLENGLRNIYPVSLSSVSTMNTVNTLNTLAANNQTATLASQNNPLSNFLTLAQQQQQQQQHSLHQQQQFSSQQNLIHHFGSNMLSNSPKGWASGATDLTAIDPAIVSSGQLTDSRSDSPPQWLKAIEQNPSEAGLGIGSWSNILPYNIITGTLQGSIGSMHNPLAPQASQQTSRRSTMWPTTSPPPGFNSLSPLHTKQREAHKIENL